MLPGDAVELLCLVSGVVNDVKAFVEGDVRILLPTVLRDLP